MTKLTESNQTDNEWGDAHLLALRAQMADAGINVGTVSEGVEFLLRQFRKQIEDMSFMCKMVADLSRELNRINSGGGSISG